jgi:hypothetical protein
MLGMKMLSLMSVIDSPMLVVEMKSLPTGSVVYSFFESVDGISDYAIGERVHPASVANPVA